MAKPVKPNWGKPLLPLPALLIEFEIEVARLGLKRSAYVASVPLKRWCYRHRNRVHVPEWLLAERGIQVETHFGRAAW